MLTRRWAGLLKQPAEHWNIALAQHGFCHQHVVAQAAATFSNVSSRVRLLSAPMA